MAEGHTLLAMRVAGPNAGHTVIGNRGTDTSASVAPNLCEPVVGGSHGDRFAWRLRSVPVAAVVNDGAALALAAGSEIDLGVLLNEVYALDRAGYQVSERLLVDPEATLIMPRHRDQEAAGGAVEWATGEGDQQSLTARQGSTGKGIGAARAERLWRVPGMRLADDEIAQQALASAGVTLSDTATLAHGMLRSARGKVLVEGTQGYGLGLHAGYYPYCTSSDCRAIDFLAMAGISPWQTGVSRANHGGVDLEYEAQPALTVWVCLRPYPIRVGGNSGPLLGETTWEELGLPAEHTTVTGKVRRVGRWDGDLARRAIRANGGPGGAVKVVVTMMDTVVPEIAGWTELPSDRDDRISHTHQQALKAETRLGEEVEWLSRECQSPIAAVGTGADTILSLADR